MIFEGIIKVRRVLAPFWLPSAPTWLPRGSQNRSWSPLEPSWRRPGSVLEANREQGVLHREQGVLHREQGVLDREQNKSSDSAPYILQKSGGGGGKEGSPPLSLT